MDIVNALWFFFAACWLGSFVWWIILAIKKEWATGIFAAIVMVVFSLGMLITVLCK